MECIYTFHIYRMFIYIPPHTKKKLPYGLALRNKRICSDPNDFEKRKGDIEQRFRQRGYNRRDVRYQL